MATAEGRMSAGPDRGGTVARRQVFYIPGYDPFPPRRYRELYRTEGRAQALLSGYSLSVIGRHGAGRSGWTVRANIEGAEVVTAIEVLVWSDIVQTTMGHGILETYVQMLRTAGTYIGSGAIFRLARLRKGPTLAALYPVLALTLGLLSAVAVGTLAGQGVIRVLPAPETVRTVLGLAAGLLAGWAVLWALRRSDGRFYAYYLMHDYAYSASHRGATPPALDARLHQFARRVSTALFADVDEVLLVGHSSGAHLGVSVLAEVIRSGHVKPGGPTLSFLSLGHVVPMVSFLPRAAHLRRDLAFLSARSELTWVDVTAPGDGCAFALCDPVAVTGVAPAGQRWPLVLSAAFTRTLSPALWRRLRWRFFRLHFQYLCAFDALPDQTDAYDYFRVTAGPMTLAQRFGARAPSASRIIRPLSGYRTVSSDPAPGPDDLTGTAA
jgi:hypothetical protein